MHKLVALGKLDPTMQRIATWIRLGVPQDQRASTTAVLDAVFRWVKRHGLFQRDPFQIEKIEHPIAAMRPIIEAREAGTYRGPALFVGDCDTIAGVYLATLGGILGFQYAFETAKVDLERPNEFSHVWVAFRTNGDWYPLDPSTPSAAPGWRPPVGEDLFARWPEKPIEDVVGGGIGMSGLNGNGLGDTHERGYYPANEYGYGIPKSFGPENAWEYIPKPDPANIQLLPPYDTQVPRADLEADLNTSGLPEESVRPTGFRGGSSSASRTRTALPTIEAALGSPCTRSRISRTRPALPGTARSDGTSSASARWEPWFRCRIRRVRRDR